MKAFLTRGRRRRLRAAVAAGHPATVEAGVGVLRAGGTAADAAVAACLASCVAETVMTGLLGGGHAIYHDAGMGRTRNLDCFCAVPSGNGGPLLELDVPFGDELVHYAVGPASCAVPGVPAGLDALWREHGRLPWAELCAPALRLAREGVPMPPAHAACLEMLAPVMTMREGAEIYAPGGSLLRTGDRLEQPGLASALELLAEEGASSVYRGSIAESLLALLADRDGVVTRGDLDRYEAGWDDPIVVPYAGTRFLTRGGLAGVASALERIPRLDCLDEPDRTLALIDALADAGGPETHTTNLVTVDADGSVCVLTTSLGLGSGDWVPGLDLHLNSMLGETDLLVGVLEPGARMQSMMAPSIALDGEGPVLAIGAAGGTRLRTALVGVAAGVLDEGLAPQAAVDRPRVHRAGEVVNAEPGADEAGARGTGVREGWPCGGGRHGTTTSAVSASYRRPARRPTRVEAEPRFPRRAVSDPVGVRHSNAGSGSFGSDPEEDRPLGPLGLLDVAGDLVDQLPLAREGALVAQALPKLDDEPPAVQVPGETEQECLDAQLVAAVVGIRPDRDRCAVARGETGVDPVRRDEQIGLGGDVRGRKPERPATSVALDDDPLDLVWAAEECGSTIDLPCVQELADRR